MVCCSTNNMSAVFSGSNYLSQADSVWNLGNPFTIAVFLKFTGSQGGQALIVTTRTTGVWFSLDVCSLVANGASFNINDSTPRWQNSNIINDGAWHSVVITRDGSGNISGYIDGSIVGTSVANSTSATKAGPLGISGDTNGVEAPYTGKMARLVIDNSNTWSPGQVSTYNSTGIPPGSPTAIFNFQISGALLNDSSGNAHSLTNHSSVTYSSDEPIAFPTASSPTLTLLGVG